MKFQDYLFSKNVISETTIRHVQEFMNASSKAINPKYRNEPNTIYLLCIMEEKNIVKHFNDFNGNKDYAVVSDFPIEPNHLKILSLTEQLDLETVVLKLDTFKREILLGCSTDNENQINKAKMVVGRKIQGYTINHKKILAIPFMKRVKEGHILEGKNFRPAELEIAVHEKVKTAFRFALEMKATDISFESRKEGTIVRLTIDKEPIFINTIMFNEEETKELDAWLITQSGVGQTLTTQKTLTFALKDLAGYKTHRARGSKMTSYWGVTINLRILPNEPEFIDIEKLNYSTSLKKYLEYAKRPKKGLILITGPTNSGKNTTAFALLSSILQVSKPKIISLENPIEYIVPDVQQTQADTLEEYHEALRELVRQSPDIIYLSEIRDDVTADAALSMSNTGKFVISTIHVSHAPQIFLRMEDLYGSDISGKLFSELIGVVNQMLIPKACPECLVEIQESKLDKIYREALSAQNYNKKIYDNTGRTKDGTKPCPNCKGNGYKGILPVAEYINFDFKLKRNLRACKDNVEREKLLIEVMESKGSSLVKDALWHMGEGNLSISMIIDKSILDTEFTF